MFYQKILLLLFLSRSLCLASEESQQNVQLTKEELIAIVKKIETNFTLRLKLLPSPHYLPYTNLEQFSEEAPQEWYEQILDCVNNNDRHCSAAAYTLQTDWEHRKAQSYWKQKEFLAAEQQEFHNYQLNDFLYATNILFIFIEGYMLAKKAKM